MCVYVSLSVCLSASTSLEPLDRSSRNFLCRSPVAVARSSFSGVAICYVFPVLWMTSRLAVTWRLHRAATAMSGMVIPGRSLMSVNACSYCLKVIGLLIRTTLHDRFLCALLNFNASVWLVGLYFLRSLLPTTPPSKSSWSKTTISRTSH